MKDESIKEINTWVKKYPAEHRRSAVLAALTIAQHENKGYLTIDVMDEVADIIQIPKIAVYEVATFYSMFETKPVGRNVIAVCTNLSCMLIGGDEILQHIENKLTIKVGESTPNGLIYLKREEECLAACSYAPVVQINHKTYQHITTERLDELLEELINE